jgi:hypothetical protein
MSGCRLDEFGLRMVILEPSPNGVKDEETHDQKPNAGEDLDSTLFRLVANLIGRGK